ncbi:unnamed protein product [Pylaiella littoralis]
MAACIVRRRGASWNFQQRCSPLHSLPRCPPTVVSKRSTGSTAAASAAAAHGTRPPLLLSFKRGKYKLNLPLKDGSVVASAERCTAFSFHPNNSLETVKANIQEEGVSNVEFTGPGGEPLPDDSSVGDAAWHGGFDMTLDGNQFPVLATRSGGYIEDDEEGGGRTELPSLLERGRVLRLRAALADETRRSMTYAEFESLCKDCGMDKADASKVAADLHKVGVVLHFHKEPGLTDIVYLQPHQVLEHFFAKYSLESPLRQYLLQQAERVEAEKEAVRRELAPTLRLKENLDEQARITVSRCMWGLSATVVSGAGGYWYLSYIYLSWDIMVRRVGRAWVSPGVARCRQRVCVRFVAGDCCTRPTPIRVRKCARGAGCAHRRTVWQRLSPLQWERSRLKRKLQRTWLRHGLDTKEFYRQEGAVFGRPLLQSGVDPAVMPARLCLCQP